jgi:hypothetical protein
LLQDWGFRNNLLIALSALLLLFSLDDAWIAAAVGAGAGLYLFLRGFYLLNRKNLILNTPSSKVRSAALGLIEVNGLAVGPYTIIAPMTGRACYCYRTVAWQLKQKGKHREWVKVAEESLHVPFYLDDNTGRLLVNPQNAEMDIHRDFSEEFSNSLFSGKNRVPDGVTRFLTRHGVDPDKRIKIEEYCIKPKNALFILGTLAENPGLNVAPSPVQTASCNALSVQFKIPPKAETLAASAGARGAAAVNAAYPGMAERAQADTELPVPVPVIPVPPATEEVVRLSTREPEPAVPAASMTQQSKIAAALMKAGIGSPGAWAAAGISRDSAPVSIADPVNRKSSVGEFAAAEFDLNPKVVLMRGDNNRAFFISWRSQREVVSQLGWKSTAYIWGGPALTLLCTYILAAHFDWL